MKYHVINAILALLVLVIGLLFIKQGDVLEDTVGLLSESPAAMTVTVINTDTDKQVTLACLIKSDVEEKPDYALDIFAVGKEPATYGCSHVKTDILTEPPAQ